jgi:mannose-1-phosphate guanylyltransferase
MKTQELIPTQQTSAGWRFSIAGEESSAEQITLIDRRLDSMNLVVRAKSSGNCGPSTKTTQHSARPSPESHHWGIVLAGGDGTRLKELTRWVCGDDRPKQFCPLLGDRTLFEATRQRAEKSLPADHIIFTLTRAHEKYYRDLLDSPSTRRIIQPYNRGTAPAILYAMAVIAQSDPDAIVSILPSDHYYSSESAFKVVLEDALGIAGLHSDSVVLLAASPKGPEVEYGWIEVGRTVDRSSGLFRVERFLEKPSFPLAEKLYRSGSLWNMFVMVGHVRAFLDIASATVPSLVQAFQSEVAASSSGAEIEIPYRTYDRIVPMDFSGRVLAPATDRLLALRLDSLEWSDLGDPYRVLVTLLEKDGSLPSWAKLWPQPEEMEQAAAAGE